MQRRVESVSAAPLCSPALNGPWVFGFDVALMIGGVMLMWFILTAFALLFVAIDIRSTPASPVLKWGFVLLTAYTGVFGAFLYVVGCREPLSGTHDRYIDERWRQVLGSTMHCVAGDGVASLREP